MNKITRVIAGGLTSIVALGALSAPAFAVVAVTPVETAVCLSVAPQLTTLKATVAAAETLLATQQAAAVATGTTMGGASSDLGTTGLAYIKALDGVGNVNGTLAAFVADATDFGNAVSAWVTAADAANDNTITIGLNSAVIEYLEGLCPPVVL